MFKYWLAVWNFKYAALYFMKTLTHLSYRENLAFFLSKEYILEVYLVERADIKERRRKIYIFHLKYIVYTLIRRVAGKISYIYKLKSASIFWNNSETVFTFILFFSCEPITFAIQWRPLRTRHFIYSPAYLVFSQTGVSKRQIVLGWLCVSLQFRYFLGRFIFGFHLEAKKLSKFSSLLEAEYKFCFKETDYQFA